MSVEEYQVIKYPDKTEYRNHRGLLHRVDGPAVEWANGSKEYWDHGRLHRLDGPAIDWVLGTKLWYQNGLFHRVDGPAIEYFNGKGEYWINGGKISKREFNRRIKTGTI